MRRACGTGKEVGMMVLVFPGDTGGCFDRLCLKSDSE